MLVKMTVLYSSFQLCRFYVQIMQITKLQMIERLIYNI